MLILYYGIAMLKYNILRSKNVVSLSTKSINSGTKLIKLEDLNMKVIIAQAATILRIVIPFLVLEHF